MVLPVVMGLAQLAPSILGLFSKNETAGKAAEVVSGVARAVTGKSGDDDALAALKADPALLLQYQQMVSAQAVELYQEETKRLEAVNATMRAEATSADPFVRRWRPFFGYVVALTWAVLMVAIGIVIVMSPLDAPGVIAATAQLSAMWGIALAVLGVAVHERSKDKQTAAGRTPDGIMAALARKIGGPGSQSGAGPGAG